MIMQMWKMTMNLRKERELMAKAILDGTFSKLEAGIHAVIKKVELPETEGYNVFWDI